MLEIAGHGLVGQHRVVWAGTMVTGINGQHLTGQKMVTTLGMGGNQVSETPIHYYSLSANYPQDHYRASPLHYLPAGALHQGLGDGVEVGLAPEQTVEEHQRSAVALPVEHVIGQVHRAEGGEQVRGQVHRAEGGEQVISRVHWAVGRTVHRSSSLGWGENRS